MTRRVAAVLLLALAVRAAAFGWSRDSAPMQWDELEYHAAAVALAQGRPAPDDERRQPGFIGYLVPFVRALGPSLPAARLANLLPSCLAVWLLFLFARRCGGERVGLLAATLAALDPTLVLYSVSILSEPLYLALSLGMLVLLASERDRPSRAALAGVLAGLAALTREVGVVLPVAGVAVLLGRGRRRTALLFATGFLVAALPWSVHLNRGPGNLALLTRTTWFNVYVGNVDPTGRGRPFDLTRGTMAYRALGKTAVEREAAARGVALRAIAERLPAWPLEKTGEMVPRMLAPASFPARRLLARPTRRRADATPGPYRLLTDGTRAERLRDVVGVGAITAWILVAVAGAAGLVLAWGEGPVSLLVLFLAVHVAASIVTFAVTRFRLPFVPVLMTGAAYLSVHGARRWREAGVRRRATAIGSALAVALLVALQWRPILFAGGG